MALESKLVLLFTRNSIFLGNQLRRHAHMEIFVNVPKAIVNHGINDFAIANAIATACPRQQIGAIGHRFHSASDDDVAFAKHHVLCSERDCLESRATDFVDGHGGDTRMQPSAQCRLPRRILAQSRLHDVAHDDFVHCVRLNACAVRDFSNNSGAKFRGRKRRERTLKFADSSTYGTQDHGLAEVWLLHNATPSGFPRPLGWLSRSSIARSATGSILAPRSRAHWA